MKEQEASKKKREHLLMKKELKPSHRLTTPTGKKTVFRLRKKKFYFSF